MFDSLGEKFISIFSKFSSKSVLTAENLQDAVNEIRLALLDADVQYSIAKKFVLRIKEKAQGTELLKSVEPGQQFVKIVHDELVALMGNDEEELAFAKRPAALLLVGLQGSGKTTACAKLCHYLLKKKQVAKPLLVACDLQRPAAVDQLKMLADQVNVPLFSLPGETRPLEVAKKSMQFARVNNHDLVLIDTAGRLHVDQELMQEITELTQLVQPEHVLYVANAATGQDAVRSATAFTSSLQVTGVILTMLDGTARGGAALSIREATNCPLRFEGVGEHIDDFQLFNPKSMADRILGMGDTINLIRKVEEHFKAEEAEAIEKKLRTASFTYEDYVSYLQAIKKMGSMKSILKMIPGASSLRSMDFDEKTLYSARAMIQSMTVDERQEKCELSMNRRRRIARGSGHSFEDVNRMIKAFNKCKELISSLPNKKQLKKMMGGLLWR